MQATMPIADPLLPQPKSTTRTHQDLSLLHKTNFISERVSSLGLLPSRPRRSVVLHGIRRSFSIQACSIQPRNRGDISRQDFPTDFFFGTASSAYQYEGAANEGGKGVSIWDQFTHRNPNKIADGSNGDVALDSYHRYKEHVAIMKDLGVNSYRFSIAWTRILPTGKLSDGVNKEGIKYYNNLIDELLSKGIEPFVTLFHWDVPQVLDDEYGGFLNSRIINDFKNYVDICFDQFGDRVKHWITMNEPNIFTMLGYVYGIMAPGLVEDHFINPYEVAHNLLLAHANAVDIYRNKYQTVQGGKIGITLQSDNMVPATNDQCDIEAAERALDFSLGWFMDPLHLGDYPESMKKLVTNNRLPTVTPDESCMLKGSYDFLGLNYYTSVYVAAVPHSPTPSYLTDGCYRTSSRKNGVPIGPLAASDRQCICPNGLQDLLRCIKERYNRPTVYVTENGISTHTSETMDQQIHDFKRVNGLKDHLFHLKYAMDEGADVKGYFIWTLLDAMEWSGGFTTSLGIHYVDYKNDLKIYRKDSAIWYKEFLCRIRVY